MILELTVEIPAVREGRNLGAEARSIETALGTQRMAWAMNMNCCASLSCHIPDNPGRDLSGRNPSNDPGFGAGVSA